MKKSSIRTLVQNNLLLPNLIFRSIVLTHCDFLQAEGCTFFICRVCELVVVECFESVTY